MSLRAIGRRRDAGGTAFALVLAFAVLFAALALASEAVVAPFAREVRRTEASDEALALAEGGVALARAELGREPGYAGSGLRLGRGRIDVAIERRDGALVVVVATGTIDRSPLVAPGDTVTRRVRVHLRVEAGATRIVAWQDM